jgi:hypothetical protein
MVNQGADRKFVRDSTSPATKPEKCPKCGGKKVTPVLAVSV